ncbi:MAG: hypothetical protein HOV94_39110 [Saccharothrix sp.]|nr:hypothetical protein [Saccharothrix sp.]
MARPPLDVERLEDDGRYAWERQPGESERDHALLLLHLALGPHRSLRETLDMVNDDPEQGRPMAYRTLTQISTTMKWKRRAQLWDAAELRRMARTAQQRRLDALERQAKLGRRLAEKGNGALLALNPLLLHPLELLKFVTTGVEMELRALREIGALHEVDFAQWRARRHKQLPEVEDLSPAQRRARMREMADHLLRIVDLEDDLAAADDVVL